MSPGLKIRAFSFQLLPPLGFPNSDCVNRQYRLTSGLTQYRKSPGAFPFYDGVPANSEVLGNCLPAYEYIVHGLSLKSSSALRTMAVKGFAGFPDNVSPG